MKISQNILKALVIGVAFAGATSCEKGKVENDLELHVCEEECAEAGECLETPVQPTTGYDDPCPTCGMG